MRVNAYQVLCHNCLEPDEGGPPRMEKTFDTTNTDPTCSSVLRCPVCGVQVAVIVQVEED